MRSLLLVVMLAAFFGVGCQAPQAPQAPQEPAARFDVDHVFLFSEQDGPEAELFEAAGFIVWPRTNQHSDQGTTGRYIYLDNVYIELLWVHDEALAEANIPRANSDFNRRQAWSGDPGVSPIGIGLRDHRYEELAPAAEYAYKADWMGPQPENVLGVFTPSDRLNEPWVFRMPNHWTREPRTRFEGEWAERLNHPNGARRLTEAVFELPQDELSEPLRIMEGDGRFRFLTGSENHLVTLTFDEGAQGRVEDFRPALPLVIRY
ncbi:MAG: VOC family protein [Planctomycetota bacterium]